MGGGGDNFLKDFQNFCIIFINLRNVIYISFGFYKNSFRFNRTGKKEKNSLSPQKNRHKQKLCEFTMII